MISLRPVWALGAAARRRRALGPCLVFERETSLPGHIHHGPFPRRGRRRARHRARAVPPDRARGPRAPRRAPTRLEDPHLAESPIRRAEPLRNAASSQPGIDSDR